MSYTMNDIRSLSIKRATESNKIYEKGDWEIIFELPGEDGESIFRNYVGAGEWKAPQLSSVVLLAIGNIVSPDLRTRYCELNADGTFKNEGTFPGPLREQVDGDTK